MNKTRIDKLSHRKIAVLVFFIIVELLFAIPELFRLTFF